MLDSTTFVPALICNQESKQAVLKVNLYSVFQDKFKSRLDKAFLLSPGGAAVNYGNIDRMSAGFAAVLNHSGVKTGDRVVVQVDKSPAAVALYLACLRIGAVYVPLNTAYTVAEVAYFLTDAAPALFVCAPESADQWKETISRAGIPVTHTLGCVGDGTISEKADQLPPHHELAERACDDIVAMLYTSGTTGRSKGAMLTLGNLLSNAEMLHEYWGFRDGDVLLHALPIYHVHGLFVALHCAMLNASSVIFLPKFDVNIIREMLPRATLMMGVPTFYTRLLDCEGFGAPECGHIRVFICGSAPLTEQTFVDFEQRTGQKILERYGMTETSMITSNPLDGDRVAGTVGYALPGIELRVVDADGCPLPPGKVGSVELKGPNVFSGYWQMAEKTMQGFRDDGFFITGDMGSLAGDGRLTLVGRSKDLIISGGFNIYPKEIESVIDNIPGVLESAVIGVPDRDFGERVLAVVVVEDREPATESSILGVTGKQMARFKQPRKVILVDELPRNTMGKVQKNILRDRYAG